MRRSGMWNHKKLVGTIASVGMVFQFGGCDFGQVTTTQTVTLDGRDVIISLIRSVIITPLDEWVTGTVNNVFGENT